MSTPLKLDKLMLTEYSAEVMVYFERHRLLEVVTRLVVEVGLERPKDPQQWMGENLVRIADEIYRNCLQNSYKGCGEIKFFQLPGRFLYRILMFGRRGSGRRTQAVALVKRFNLVYIDAEHVIYQSLRASDEWSVALQRAFAADDLEAKSNALGQVIARRLLQTDALRQGWILLNYPNSLKEFQEVLEHFKVPPNKVVYLECPEQMAMRRLLARPSLGRPQDSCDYMEQEMLHFAKNEAEINEYLGRRHETICIDSTPCFEAVKTNLWVHLERSDYVMGFKY